MHTGSGYTCRLETLYWYSCMYSLQQDHALSDSSAIPFVIRVQKIFVWFYAQHIVPVKDQLQFPIH